MSEYVNRAPLRKAVRNARIRKIDIELTERCNNNCIHCCINLPATDLNAQSREMSTEQVKAVLREAAELGCMRVRFTGGEPLLRPDFEDLYLYARRFGLKVKLFTNATLITEKLAALFAEIPPRTAIEITSYGMHHSSYEAITQVPGSYKLFRRGLHLLSAKKIPFLLKTVLLPPNRHELAKFEQWSSALNYQNKITKPIIHFDFRCRRDNPDKDQAISSLRLTPEDYITVMTRDIVKFKSSTQKFAEKFSGFQGDRLFNCGAGKAICIDAYGMAQPCMGVRQQNLCFDLFGQNIERPVSAALDYMKVLKSIRSNTQAYLERCAKCFLQPLCDQCPAKSWSEHDDLDTPVEYCCAITHAKAQLMGWLEDGEKSWEIDNWEKKVYTMQEFKG